MRSSWQLAVAIAVLLLQFLPAFADDVITNIVSPVVSYQYYDSFGEDTNATVISPIISYQFYDALGEDTNSAIVSPIVSYQYFDWAGVNALNLQSSPVVSYDYLFLDAPVLTILPTTRVPTTAESTTPFILPPSPPQLETFVGGSFTANPPFPLDPNQMTIVLTHGWIPTLNGTNLFPNGGPDGWPTDMAKQLLASGITGNIVAWNWTNGATSSVFKPEQAGSQSTNGLALGQALLNELGPNYSKKIHFIGHSFGTLANAYAANFLQGANFASEQVSPTPWPATNMLMTLFDEAEIGANKNFNLSLNGIENWFALAIALADGNGNYLNSAPAYYHPLPKQFAWADNYLSAFGLLHTNAVNVILTDGLPTDAPDPISLLKEIGAFHGYPIQWYDETVQSDNSAMGFVWADLWSLNDPTFANAPTNGSVFVQADNSSPWNLTPTSWSYGTNYLNQRFQAYQNGLGSSTAQIADNILTAHGTAIVQAVWDITTDNPEWIIGVETTVFNSITSQVKVRPLGLSANDGSSSTNVPAYAWMQLIVPANAISLSFDYRIQGDWQSDSLAAAFNGTNVLLIAGNMIQTNVTFGSGSIDVSAYAGQTNEFFIGIIGGTSTNAQLTVENLAFSISSPPSLQAQASGNNFVMAWPLSSQNFNLQTTTNLTDPNSWTTLTNVPMIVNLQNTVTVGICQTNQFYRLISQ